VAVQMEEKQLHIEGYNAMFGFPDEAGFPVDSIPF